MELKIGCSGWMYPFWKETFYPKSLPQKEWFSFYKNHFNTVEVNNSFYHFPTAQIIEKWYQQAPRHFTYFLKAHRSITHLEKFKDTDVLLNKMYQLGDDLKEKLDVILFQLPPHFSYDSDKLGLILKSLNKNYLNVVEFRHPSWWNPEVFESCTDNQVVFCSVTAARLPNELINCNGNVYMRFHERIFEDCYNEKELEGWALKIQQTNAKKVWVYFNNSLKGYAPANALSLKHYLL